MEPPQVAQELGLSQQFPSHMFPQQGLSSRAPEAWQEAKEHKERSRSGADRASRKRKAGSLGNVSGTKAETPAESGTGPFPSAPLHIPLSRLREIEAELICADEADSEFESGEPVAPAVPPAVPPAAAQPPGQAPGDSRWHRAGAGLQAALREGSARCRQRDFAAAAAKFSTALELCSKGFAIEDPLKSSPDDISRLASWIESKLVVCYLKLEQPGLALHHSHRSIIQNPSHFCNHLRQATCFRCLHRYSEAARYLCCSGFHRAPLHRFPCSSQQGRRAPLFPACLDKDWEFCVTFEPLLCLHTSLSAFIFRSAMVAQCLYVLAEGAGLETSDLLQLYWQVMIQEAIRGESSFSALYTPFEKEDKADKIKEANKTFAEKHPDYVQHIFTDPHGIHLLPEKAESHPDQQYLLTLGFRNKEIGKTVEKFVTRKLPVFPGQKITFSPSMEEAAETFWQNTGERIMAAMAFLGSTKIKDERGPCAQAIEQFHHASLLSHLQRGEEQAQVITQAMAELATVPYLQRVSEEDDKLLQSLMADAMDILAGRTGERVWTKIQKVALIEEYLREGEELYLRTPHVQIPGMENINWTPRGQKYLRLENTNMFIPNPRSLTTCPKKRHIVFAKS
ncbi:PREDICTED: spermatogenesis-associated protein 16 [Pseudopodoces humilis]|uniref:spermatogenesis-associated protein 16 n=1 Tax=Pseudopodoces humilis TaxID=181119 RepID=UPI0006B71050|nr:PREDICTED: spermatogenesis-associated protein 16 [Pseudopodoces humilis]